MDNPLFIKGMNGPKRNRFSAAAAFMIVGTAALAGHLMFDAQSREPSVATLDQRLHVPVQAGPAAGEGTEIHGPVKFAGPADTVRTVSVRLKAGETAAGALSRVGADPGTLGGVLESLSRFVDLRTLRPGQRLVADLGLDGRVRSLKFPLNQIDYVEIAPADDGGWQAVRREIPTDRETVEAACRLNGTLYESLKSCGMDTGLVPVIVDLLESQIDFFTDIRKGDTLRIIVQKESVNGDFVRFGRVEGLLFEGKLASAGAFARENRAGEVLYYDSEGYSVERPFVRAPVKYNPVTAGSARRRLHPILHAYTPGRAVDYSVPRGTPVFAVGAGEVIFSGRKGSSGNVVVVRHADGLQTYYAHLDSVRKGIKAGTTVDRGAQIGSVGSSGAAKETYLHFAVARQGRFVQTRTLSDKPGVPVDESAKDDFLAHVGKVTGRLKSLAVSGVEMSGN